MDFAVERKQLVDRLENVRGRQVPFGILPLTTTAAIFHTVASGRALRVERLVVANVTTTAATLTLYAAPEGGSPATANAALVGLSVPANSALDLTSLIGGYYAQGTTLQALSGTDAALNLSGYYEDVF